MCVVSLSCLGCCPKLTPFFLCHVFIVDWRPFHRTLNLLATTRSLLLPMCSSLCCPPARPLHHSLVVASPLFLTFACDQHGDSTGRMACRAQSTPTLHFRHPPLPSRLLLYLHYISLPFFSLASSISSSPSPTPLPPTHVQLLPSTPHPSAPRPFPFLLFSCVLSSSKPRYSVPTCFCTLQPTLLFSFHYGVIR